MNIRAGYNETPSPEKSTMQEEAIERISFGIGFPLSSNILINATLVNSNWDKISSDTYAPSEAIESVSAKKFFSAKIFLALRSSTIFLKMFLALRSSTKKNLALKVFLALKTFLALKKICLC